MKSRAMEDSFLRSEGYTSSFQGSLAEVARPGGSPGQHVRLRPQRMDRVTSGKAILSRIQSRINAYMKHS